MTALQGHSLFQLAETDSTTSRHILLCNIMRLLALTSKPTEKPAALPMLIGTPPHTQTMVTHHAVQLLMLLKVKR